MRYIFTLSFFVLSFFGKSQNYTVVVKTSEFEGESISWNIKDAETGQTIYLYNHIMPAQMSIILFELIDGDYIFNITNSNCESFSCGVFSFTSNDDVIFYASGSFGCGTSIPFTCSTENPCDTNCPYDFDNNGVVGVSDLILFIAEYGTTCK